MGYIKSSSTVLSFAVIQSNQKIREYLSCSMVKNFSCFLKTQIRQMTGNLLICIYNL